MLTLAPLSDHEYDDYGPVSQLTALKELNIRFSRDLGSRRDLGSGDRNLGKVTLRSLKTLRSLDNDSLWRSKDSLWSEIGSLVQKLPCQLDRLIIEVLNPSISRSSNFIDNELLDLTTFDEILDECQHQLQVLHLVLYYCDDVVGLIDNDDWVLHTHFERRLPLFCAFGSRRQFRVIFKVSYLCAQDIRVSLIVIAIVSPYTARAHRPKLHCPATTYVAQPRPSSVDSAQATVSNVAAVQAMGSLDPARGGLSRWKTATMRRAGAHCYPRRAGAVLDFARTRMQIER